MKALKKIWLRLIISIIFGAFAAELVHYNTGNSSPQLSSMIMLFVGSVVFIVLSLLVWISQSWGLFFPKDVDDKDILDK